jgi:hypothetical protein
MATTDVESEMNEEFLKVGYQLDGRLTWFYIAIALVLSVFAFRSKSSQLRRTNLAGGSVGFFLAGILNLPSPWNFMPIAIGVIGGSLLGMFILSEKSTLSKWLNTIVVSVVMLGLGIFMFYQDWGKIVLSETMGISYTHRGEEWGRVIKGPANEVRGFRVSYSVAMLWSVEEDSNHEMKRSFLPWSTSDIFWSKKYGILNGDQVAFRIAEWSGSNVTIDQPIEKRALD